MAPEQARGSKAVGPAADIYALGAILYELLTGKPPFKAATTLDTVLQVLGDEPVAVRRLQPKVPRDLETICHKCLEKDPKKRYATAAALAEDLRRFGSGEPVAARPVRLAGRLWKWAQRRPAVAALLGVVALVAVAGLGGILWAYQRAVRGEESARAALARESEARQRTRAALDEMSSQVIDDWLSRRGQLEPAQRAFLEKALGYYEDFAAQPGQTADIRKGAADAHLRIGKIRARLGQHAEAETAYRRALELASSLAADYPTVGDYRQAIGTVHNHLGLLLGDIGRAKEAEAAYQSAVDILRSLASDYPGVPQYRRELGVTYNDLGLLLSNTGRTKEAEGAHRDAVAILKPLVADFPAVAEYRRGLAASVHNLARLLRATGRARPAEDTLRDALEIFKALAADFPVVPQYQQDLAQCYSNLGLLLPEVGRASAAQAALHEALVVQKQLTARYATVPEYRQNLATTYNNLGILLGKTGHAKEAEAAYRDSLDIQKALAAGFPSVPQYHEDLASCQVNLAGLLQGAGRAKEAQERYHEALAIFRRLVADFPSEDLYQALLANTLVGLAEICHKRKDYATARQLLDDAQAHLQAALASNPRHPFYRSVFCGNRQQRAAMLLEQGEHASAALAAAELAHGAVDPIVDTYNAACFLSLCIPLAQKDTKLPEARRKELAQSYGAQAVHMLEQAVAKGYKDAANVKKDQDLDPLRRRDDFQKLLADLDKRAGQDKVNEKRPEK
jgi:tetratricopeptide (TPR) repeat protein